jgi:hypothetical protein
LLSNVFPRVAIDLAGWLIAGAAIGTASWLLSNYPPKWLFVKPPKDACDPNGAKAPRKPGPNEGFEDPKGGENWVRNPNGRGWGWDASDGTIWVPTGPGGEAHAGPHWDVQNGGYENVYPGGTRR